MSSQNRLAVIALGGHTLGTSGDIDFASERTIVQGLEAVFASLAEQGYRLLVVHGNGPQVGRSVLSDEDLKHLDILTAQTQGELGYLLAQALPEPNVCLITRVIVAPVSTAPTKPIGQLLKERPESVASIAKGEHWRIVVDSPEPIEVVELQAIRTLLTQQHVVAAGGGGIPLDISHQHLSGVVDKDWTAALLATALNANLLAFVTNVDGVFEDIDQRSARPIDMLSVAQADDLLRIEGWGVGSMAPKLESACRYVRATGRSAVICKIDQLFSAMQQKAGTVVSP